jgi:uncharacterized repeat protein (TIGR01451 family)
LANVTVSARNWDSGAGTSPNGSHTFTLTKQVFTGSSDCTTGAGLTTTVAGVGNATPHTFAIGASDSVKLTATALSNQNGPFDTWVSSDGGTFNVPFGTRTACVQGSAAPHTYVVNWKPGAVILDGPACAGPKTLFNLGETVCVKVYANPAIPGFPLQVAFKDPNSPPATRNTPASFAVTSDGQQFNTFVLPATNTAGAAGTPGDNRGKWFALIVNAALTASFGQGNFFVRNATPGQERADLQVQKLAFGSQVRVGGTMQYEVKIANLGPDPALTVQLADSTTPATMTFFSLTQLSGPPFVCLTPAVDATGAITCTIASLPATLDSFNDTANVATFRIVLKAAAGATGQINNVATASATTGDLAAGNNSATAPVTIGTVCSFAAGCPADITATADTTCNGNPGKMVTFSTPTTVAGASCGTITSSPGPSPVCFPVGSTPVTFTDGNTAVCQFIVTINPPGGPTAAKVSVSGRILTSAGGQGIARARVTMAGPNGTRQTAITNAFGYYLFDNVESGESYVVSVDAKRYQFTPQFLKVMDTLSEVDFYPQP